MYRNEYIKRMKAHRQEFEVIWNKIMDDTLEYKKANTDANMLSHVNDVEDMADDFALSCAWLYDVINDTKHKRRTM